MVDKKSKLRLVELKKNDSVTIHSVHENHLQANATVNCAPEDQQRVTDLVEDMGFKVVSYEELVDAFDDTRFTRIKLNDEEFR